MAEKRGVQNGVGSELWRWTDWVETPAPPLSSATLGLLNCSVPQFPHLQGDQGLNLTPKAWFLKISYNLLCRIISNVLMCVSQIPGHTVISLRTETGHFPFLVFSLHFSAHYTLNKLTPLTDNHIEHLGGSKERCAYSSWPLLKIRGTSRPRFLNDVNIWPL